MSLLSYKTFDLGRFVWLEAKTLEMPGKIKTSLVKKIYKGD